MTIKKKISIGILSLVCAVMLLFAGEIFWMASSGNLMPVMEQNIGKTSTELRAYSPGLLSVFFTSIKAVSALLLSISVGILILIYGPFRKQRKWASIVIYALLFVWLIPAILIYSSQPNAPWMLWVALLVLVVISLVLEILESKKVV
ncbi:hypothetical protein [Salinimicrobium xinjiangense]|uniref:hypothetical protein n=1 Tax=Salinimicrobium xinjiangense TaxID=438596 RepID=UPI00041660B6|nr:hypothetical protein [Salinimicrobium xinjiangense]